MPSWAELTDAELAALYARIPDIGCKGLCWDACGPINMGSRERQRLRKALREQGSDLPTHAEQVRLQKAQGGYYRCPALTDDDRCGHYDLRPMICRLWGTFRGMECPYGCTPADGRLLRQLEAAALIDASMKAGTVEPRLTEKEMAAAYDRNPAIREAFDAIMAAAKPVDSRGRPRGRSTRDQSPS